jgi:membrane protein
VEGYPSACLPRDFSEDRILLVAAGVTFYLLLSIFPGIAALFSIYGLFANPADIAGHLDALANVAPGGAIDLLREDMTRLASNGGTTLGIGFLVSLAVSLWTTNSGVSAIFDALNHACPVDTQEHQIW